MKYLYMILLSMLTAGNLISQNRFYIAPAGGYFLYHSDNKLPITARHNLKWTYGICAGYEFKPFNRFRPFVEITCQQTGKVEVNSIVLTDAFGAHIGNIPINMDQRIITIDASLIKPLNARLSWGGGLSCSNINHAIISPEFNGEKLSDNDDRFNVVGMGMHSFLRYGLNEDKSLFAIVKVRLNTTVIKFENGRDLSSYNLEYFMAQVYIGYSFSINK